MSNSSPLQMKFSGSQRLAAFALTLLLLQVLALALCLKNPGWLSGLGFSSSGPLLALMALVVLKTACYAWYVWPRSVIATPAAGA